MTIGTEPNTAESIENYAALIRAKLHDLEIEMFGEAKVCKTNIAWTFPEGEADDTKRLESAKEALSHAVEELLGILSLAKNVKEAS